MYYNQIVIKDAFAGLEVEEVLRNLHVKESSGLSSLEVGHRLKEYGHNQVAASKKRHIIIEFLSGFTNPLVILLIFIVVTSFAIGETVSALLVTCMIILSVGLNFLQEHKAGRAAEKLQEKVAHIVTVIRDHKEQNIKAILLVPGDILVLNAGDLIPADARIIECKDLFVNESSLTGESYPIEKTVAPSLSRTDSHHLSMVYSGSSVVTGTGLAVVVRTGKNTEFGELSLAVSSRDQDNSFTLGVKHFSYFILRIVLIFVLFIFIVNALFKHDLLQSLTFAIAVAVGLTPEFLPMIMTVTMSIGAVEMSKKGVIVKKLSAIPSFGSMNILCTDKTGTITQDQITLVKYVDLKGSESDEVLEYAYLNSRYQTGITNPLDQAVLSYKKLNLRGYKKIDEIPFDFYRRRMSVVTEKDGKRLLIVKGAPEAIAEVSTLKGSDNNIFLKEFEHLSSEGYRVLAIAVKIVDKAKSYTKHDEQGLKVVGFTAFLDPVKRNAKEAIDGIEDIGIEVKVVTGDNELVTGKACTDAGINVKGVMLGSDIEKMSDQELGMKARDITIFARFSPLQKERLVKALKNSGCVVGYMGDGINDAASLKSADVGISVSNAVDVARESADFILTHKSLGELKDGVIEGRKIFGNTMKYIMMGLSSNFGNMFSVLGAVLFLPFLPMLPIQILLNNFLYDLSQITIPTDHVDPEYIKTPKVWNIKFLKRFMLIFGPISSLFDFATFLFLFLSFRNLPGAFQTGWFMESLATQSLVIHLIRTNKVPFFKSLASYPLVLSTVGIVALGWIIPHLSFGTAFHFVPLPPHIVIGLSVITSLYLVSVEIGKKIFYRVNS